MSTLQKTHRQGSGTVLLSRCSAWASPNGAWEDRCFESQLGSLCWESGIGANGCMLVLPNGCQGLLDRKLKERIGLKQIVDPFMSSLVKTWLVYEISTKQHPVFNLQSRRMHMATGAMRSSLWLGWSWSEIVDMVSASHWVTTLPL